MVVAVGVADAVHVDVGLDGVALAGLDAVPGLHPLADGDHLEAGLVARNVRLLREVAIEQAHVGAALVDYLAVRETKADCLDPTQHLAVRKERYRAGDAT